MMFPMKKVEILFIFISIRNGKHRSKLSIYCKPKRESQTLTYSILNDIGYQPFHRRWIVNVFISRMNRIVV